jgi:hypothetical protein
LWFAIATNPLKVGLPPTCQQPMGFAINYVLNMAQD